MIQPPIISVILPVLDEETNLDFLYERLVHVLASELKITYELIFVDDGSTDRTWDCIREFQKRDISVRGLRFTRNFGHQYALKAGLDYAKGQAVVTMDADLQHPPEAIKKFYHKWLRGYKVVNGVKKNTDGASLFKNITSKTYYYLINVLSNTKVAGEISDFRLMDKQVVHELKKMTEGNLFIRGIVDWLGYKSTTVDYYRCKRFSGKPKYSIFKMLNFGLDGIVSFSIKPIRVACGLGLSTMFLAILAWFFGTNISGLLFAILFLCGVQLLSIGILGEYVGRLFVESKKRPAYIISDRV